ncbi:hypothetical protein GCM10009539_73780 [Cryptosporangium japonicum]|uniref:Uncharacterized protein n=1 Tax=Cryptosporangium japonicum TaxID=80872 RepID=A0ABN0V508_9ACTN
MRLVSAGLQVPYPTVGPGITFVVLCTYAWIRPLLRVGVPPTEDPGYTMPPVAAVVIAVIAVALTAFALRHERMFRPV